MAKAVTTTKTVDFTSVNFAVVAQPIVTRYAQLCLTQVKEGWPVDTGQSKAGWEVTSRVDGSTAKIILTNTTPYAQYVESRKAKGLNGQEFANAIVAKNTALMNLEIETALAEALSNATRKV